MSATRRRAIGIVILVGGVLTGSAAPAAAAARGCRLGSLYGAFGVKFDGHSENLGRVSAIGLWTFDGQGQVVAAETFNSEATGPVMRTIEGSYTIQRNCRFTLRFPSEVGQQHDAIGQCVLVDDGKELYCIDDEDGWVATSVGKAVFSRQSATAVEDER